MEKNQTMTDEQLARELQNGKRGRGRGKLLTVVGCVVLAIGIFTSVTALMAVGFVLMLRKGIIVPCVILAVVWVCHLVYFLFGVKTIPAAETAQEN